MNTSAIYDDDNCPSRAFGRGAIWPIGPESLAALIDIGLSDAQIGAYFAVTVQDVLVLRDRHDLRLAHPDCSEATVHDGSKPMSRQIDFQMVDAILYDMADGLSAADAYLQALKKINDERKNDLYPDVVGRAADQVQRAGFAYRRLRKCLDPAPTDIAASQAAANKTLCGSANRTVNPDCDQAGDEMELEQAIVTRRAVREYTSETVDEATLRQLIEAATLAPSAVNEQPALHDDPRQSAAHPDLRCSQGDDPRRATCRRLGPPPSGDA